MNLPRVKICGITRIEDAQLAVQLGAWAIGFIFYRKSSRLIAPTVAASIRRALPSSVRTFGVFVDSSIEEIMSIAETSGIDSIQLHGGESPEFCTKLKMRVNNCLLVKALRVGGVDDLPLIVKTLNEYSDCDFVLLDTFVAGPDLGGTGKTFDWGLADMIPRHLRLRLIIAGGLHAQNAPTAIDAFTPFAIDVSSGVERTSGIKDEMALRAFFQALMVPA